MKQLLMVVFVAGVADAAAAKTLLVPEEYATIQGALDTATCGDHVSVAPGVYHEHVVFGSNGVTLKSRELHKATIDGQGEGHVVVLNARAGTIEGFVVTGSGSGIHGGVFTSQGSQVIRKNIIRNNLGDGISISSGSIAHIEGNFITNNGSWHAGIDCKTGAGGVVANNFVARQRYGLQAYDCKHLTIVNNTFIDHHAWNLFFGRSTARVINNILAHAGTGILFTGPYSRNITELVGQYLFVSHNLVWRHREENYFAELGGDPDFLSGSFSPLPGQGELRVDPQLVSDFMLAPGSPCIDAGHNGGVPPGVYGDLLGKARFIDHVRSPDTGALLAPIVDIGAWEMP